MSTDPFALLNTVCDEESFVRFLSALALDRKDEISKENMTRSSPFGPGINGWENVTVETFLFAAATWAEASAKGLPIVKYTPSSNPWRRCAEILYAGKIYE